MLEETQKAPKTAELEEPSCTGRRKLSWRLGLTELARLAKELSSGKAREETEPNKTNKSALMNQPQPNQKRPRPSSPSSPGPPSGMTRAPPGDLASTSYLYKEFDSLLQAPDLSYSIESSSCTGESDIDTDSILPGLLSKESNSTSDEPSSSNSESSFNTCESSFDTNEPSYSSEVIRKKTYAKNRKKKAPDEFQERGLATQRRPGRGRPRPNRPVPPWTPNGTPHSLQTTKDTAGRALDSPRQCMPEISSMEFETLTALNMAKILRSTAGLLENIEKEDREPHPGQTPRTRRH